MYDISKLVFLNFPTVGEVIEQLKTLPADANFACCGSPEVYIHVEDDDSYVCMEYDDRAEEYPDDNDEDEEDDKED